MLNYKVKKQENKLQNVKQKISMRNNKVKKLEEQVVQTPPGCNCKKVIDGVTYAVHPSQEPLGDTVEVHGIYKRILVSS